MTRGKKRKFVKISQNRREHVIKRLQERFGINNFKEFFIRVKLKHYDILINLYDGRQLCELFYNENDIYFILKDGKEVATVLNKEIVIKRYKWKLKEVNYII